MCSSVACVAKRGGVADHEARLGETSEDAAPPPPPPPGRPPAFGTVACTPHTALDAKVEKCTSWCAGVANAASKKCSWCKCSACAACSKQTLPYITVNVIDRDNSTEWLGHWEKYVETNY